MSADLIPQRCDECGQKMAKAHRIYKGHRYCATCYSRIFKRQICPKCGNFARLPMSDPVAVCRACENDRPCIRCGKIGYVTGKITIYGPVCNACSPYFRKPELCEVCGVLSSRLTRLSRLGHGCRICPKCARADYGTCQACSRYRWLLENPDGRMLCKTCLEKGEVACPKCTELMPAGCGSQCQHCYWRGLLKKRIQMDCTAFSLPKMAMHFEAFGYWLMGQVGENKAAMTIHRYLPFFMEVERNWKDFPEFAVLLMHFGTAKLRCVLLPMRWVEVTGLVVPDEAAKADDSELRRIVVILDKFAKGVKERTLLEGYYRTLMESLNAGKMTLRSVRLALSPAAALLCKASEMDQIPPNQKVLCIYLAKVPGQRAAISGFVRYLREVHDAKIALPKANPGRAQRQRRKRLEMELLALMTKGGSNQEFKQQWLSVALQYFHGLDKKIRVRMNDTKLSSSNGGVIVTWQNQNYWLPICWE